MKTNEYNFNINNDHIKKRTRRSKNDLKGRNKQCPHCDKSYLSEIALNSHIKAKHPNKISNVQRSRGRPRKLDSIHVPINNSDDIDAFFENPSRKLNINDEQFDIILACNDVLTQMYDNYKDILFNDISSIDEIQLIDSELDNRSVDSALWLYTITFAERMNKYYFEIFLKFIILLRASINKFKLNPGFSISDESSEFIPEKVNEFLSDFMDDNGNFEMDINEVISIVQHLCNWLWINKLTTLRLSIIN